jgi:hypothetical protein
MPIPLFHPGMVVLKGHILLWLSSSLLRMMQTEAMAGGLVYLCPYNGPLTVEELSSSATMQRSGSDDGAIVTTVT